MVAAARVRRVRPRSRGEEEARRFETLLLAPDEHLDVIEAALVIAGEESGAKAEQTARKELQSLLNLVKQECHTAPTEAEKILRLTRFFFGTERFRGEEEHYYHPQAALLDRVLERRRGLPIILGILFATLGEAVGITFRGVNFPGHFLVRYDGEFQALIDPLSGEVVTELDCSLRLKAILGSRAVFDKAYLRPASPRHVLGRLLTNLKHAYLRANNLPGAIRALDRILMIDPRHIHALRERAVLKRKSDMLKSAREDFIRFLALAGEDPATASARAAIEEIDGILENLN